MVRDIIICGHFPNCRVEGNRFPFYVKENAGLVNRSVDTVEQAVKTMVGSVYLKFDGKPLEILHFLDRKVCIVIPLTSLTVRVFFFEALAEPRRILICF